MVEAKGYSFSFAIITTFHNPSMYKKSTFNTSTLSQTAEASVLSTRKSPKKKTLTIASRSVLRFADIDDNLQLLKISLKKETDRRVKLKKLLEKYTEISTQEKKHVKNIKSSIIEMKDESACCKIRLLVDPTVLVDNQIKVQTREFLCTLMNTFYKAYANNEKNNQVISCLNGTMSFLIKGISFTEDSIFMLQKSQINEQMQLEGDLMAQKNRLKDEQAKAKDIKQVYEAARKQYQQAKQQHESAIAHLHSLQAHLEELESQSQSMEKSIEYQTNLRAECQSQIDKEILYQNKLLRELAIVEGEVEREKKQAKDMTRRAAKTAGMGRGASKTTLRA